MFFSVQDTGWAGSLYSMTWVRTRSDWKSACGRNCWQMETHSGTAEEGWMDQEPSPAPGVVGGMQ